MKARKSTSTNQCSHTKSVALCERTRRHVSSTRPMRHDVSAHAEFAQRTTRDPHEISKFSGLCAHFNMYLTVSVVWSHEWWNPEGPLKPLHHINPTRVKYIKDNILRQRKGSDTTNNADSLLPLQSLTLLDVGCGAGLLTEVAPHTRRHAGTHTRTAP